MSIQLFDLPDELLLYIISYITNIREKIRLASVSSVFHNLVTEACRIQNYKLVNHSDYMYESEYQKVDNRERFINLHELLRIAPRLTHFVDKVYHFGYETHSHSNPQYREPLSLIHTKYLYLDLCRSFFFGKKYETSFDKKADIVLSNIPAVTVLDIRADKECNIQFPVLTNLKVFKFSFFLTDHFPQTNVTPNRFIEMVSRIAPNLEELYFSSRYVDVCFNLPGLLTNLSINCPNLRVIKLFFQISPYSRNVYSNFMTFKDEHKLLKLEYLDLRGISVPISFWDKLLSLTPNLKFLAFDHDTDRQIARVITRHCNNVKFNIDRPFEVEEEFRIYTQRTYGFIEDRYL